MSVFYEQVKHAFLAVVLLSGECGRGRQKQNGRRCYVPLSWKTVVDTADLTSVIQRMLIRFPPILLSVAE